MEKLSTEEQDFAYDVMIHVIKAGGEIDIPEVLANFRLLGRGLPFGRACVRTGEHPALASWPKEASMALTVVQDGRTSPELWGPLVVNTRQKAPREEEKAPRVVAGYTVFEHPQQLVVALTTAQIVAKAMSLCYREDPIGDDVIDGPLLLMLKAGSAEPYMGKKGGYDTPNGHRYEDWATKALQELLGENPLTWTKIIADGGHVEARWRKRKRRRRGKKRRNARGSPPHHRRREKARQSKKPR